MEFVTDRCNIRKLRTEDFEDFYEMQSSMNVMRYVKPPLNYEESKMELEKFINYYSDDSRFFLLWAIEQKNTRDFLGICGVYHNELNENEIAYRFRENYWGMGYGSEVARALISHCFSEFEIKEIVAHADEENTGSLKILEREMKFVERVFSEKSGRHERKYILSTGADFN